MIAIIFAVFLVAHGVIHLIGPARAYRLADLPQIGSEITPVAALLWLGAAMLFVVAAVMLFAVPRWWWLSGAAAIAISTIAISRAWSDAKFGAIANAIALAGVVLGFLVQGPVSQRAEYDEEVRRHVHAGGAGPPVVAEDLATLPRPLRRYLHAAGVVGQPHVRNLRASVRGRIRSVPGAPWMPFTGEQHNALDPPARLFYIDAWRGPLPVQVLHRYVGAEATMRARAAGAVTVVNQSGPAMTRAETVTLFNDMCLLAPAMLVDAPVTWEDAGNGAVRGTFTNAGHTVRATLFFNDDGMLSDFVSDDRARATDDGRMLPSRWSTPVSEYRQASGLRVFAKGEGRWEDASGEFTYIEFEVLDLRYNVR